MFKFSAKIRLIPKDDNLEARIGEGLRSALASPTIVSLFNIHQEIDGSFKDDILMIENANTAETTTTLLDTLESFAKKVKKDGGWFVNGYAVGWDEDGFIVKAELSEDGNFEWASPNWILLKSVKEMKSLMHVTNE